MMRKTSPKSHHRKEVPPELLKSLTAEARVNGQWVEVGSIDNNRTRLIKLDFAKVKTTAIRLHLKETYGHPTAKLFEVRCYEDSHNEKQGISSLGRDLHQHARPLQARTR